MSEKKAIIPKDWPQRMWKHQRNILIVRIRKDMLLLSYLPLRCFYATTAAKAKFEHLVNVFVMGAVSMTASILFRAKSSGTASEHLGDVFNDDGSEGFPMLTEIVQPIIVGIKELCSAVGRSGDTVADLMPM